MKKRSMKLKALVALTAPVFGMSPVLAEDTVLGDVVVYTASGRAQSVADVQAAVQVVGERDLQAYTGTSVTEALKLAVGVDARPNGANSMVTMRGLSSSATLLLVDGQRRTSKYGSRNLNLFAVEDVERIEIVRGPMSALYGADASGGVVNVITRKPALGSGPGGRVASTWGRSAHGQRETAITGASVEYGGDVSAHRVSVEHRDRGLFRYDRDSPTADLNRIDERYYAYDGYARVGSDHRINWRIEHLDQNDTGPGLLAAAPPSRPVAVPFDAYERERRDFAQLGYQGLVAGGVLDVDLSRGHSDAKTTRAYPTIETTDFVQHQAMARYTRSWGAHTLVLGVGSSRDELDVSLNSRNATRVNDHLLLQDEWVIAGDWRALLGVRHDRFDDFGSTTNPRLSVSWQPGPWSVRLGYGEAFRAPSVLEQYSRFVRGGRSLIVGNPDLKPEQNRSWEIAFGYAGARLRAELVAYDSRVSDLITTVRKPRESGDPAAITVRSVYTNVSDARVRGAELSLAWQLDARWFLQGGWEYIDARDASSDERLRDRSRQIARLGVRYDAGRLSADVQARYHFDYYNSDPNDRSTDAPAFNSNFGATDLKLSYRVTEALTAAIGVDNVFNTRAPSNYGSATEPAARFAYVSGRYVF